MKIFNKSLFFIFIAILASCDLAPGSFPYAEKYEINESEDVFSEAIIEFQINNPQYMVPEQTQLQNGRDSEKDHWYHIYFYYPDENQIIYTWTRPAGKDKTTLAFVSINDGLTLGNWKDINNDYGRLENKNHKEKFEERILSKVKESL